MIRKHCKNYLVMSSHHSDQMSQGSLCSVVKTLIVSGAGRTEGQGHLLSCSGQLKTKKWHPTHFQCCCRSRWWRSHSRRDQARIWIIVIIFPIVITVISISIWIIIIIGFSDFQHQYQHQLHADHYLGCQIAAPCRYISSPSPKGSPHFVHLVGLSIMIMVVLKRRRWWWRSYETSQEMTKEGKTN